MHVNAFVVAYVDFSFSLSLVCIEGLLHYDYTRTR
jgi:hypothetical protein